MSDEEIVERLYELQQSLEVTADRCSRQLLTHDELEAAVREIQGELAAVLPEGSDGFRVFDRLRSERTVWRVASRTKYVDSSDCKRIQYWLDAIRQTLETLEPAFLKSPPRNQVLLQSGDSYGAKSKLFALLKRAQRQLDLVDSYMDDEIFPYLESLPEGLSVRLVTLDRKPIFWTLYEALRSTRPGIEARQSRQFHDRFIILDGEEVWHLGASLNGIGSKTTLLSRILDPEESARFLAEFESEWEAAARIESA